MIRIPDFVHGRGVPESKLLNIIISGHDKVYLLKIEID